jgi:hypothetical protein
MDENQTIKVGDWVDPINGVDVHWDHARVENIVIDDELSYAEVVFDLECGWMDRVLLSSLRPCAHQNRRPDLERGMTVKAKVDVVILKVDQIRNQAMVKLAYPNMINAGFVSLDDIEIQEGDRHE